MLIILWYNNFYPRSPRGERPALFNRQSTLKPISIHAPREGSDQVLPVIPQQPAGFLSTLPARGATGAAART